MIATWEGVLLTALSREKLIEAIETLMRIQELERADRERVNRIYQHRASLISGGKG